MSIELEEDREELVELGKEQVSTEIWETIGMAISGLSDQTPVFSVVNSSNGTNDAWTL